MYSVLHILTGDDGGITNVVKTYYKFMDREKIHFDIACTTKCEGSDLAEMRKMGAEIYHLPMKSLGLRQYIRSLKEILRQKDYHAIHVHESETSYVALKVAKQCGIKCRIAHAHSSAPYTSIKNEIRRLSGIVLNYTYATTVVGCGLMAGERIFGKINMKRKNAVILPNAIDMSKFNFDSSIRLLVRKELGVSDKFVVGFIGRLAPEKNLMFCLEVIKEYRRINANAVLMIAGAGIEESRIRQYIKEYRMEEYVYLLGKRTDVERLYQAFDAFILPSLYEAFPLVAVEAIAAGLPVLLSTDITPEFSFSQSVCYIKTNKVSGWVEYLNFVHEKYSRIEHLNELDPNVFDIKCASGKLEEIYLTK